MKICVFGASSDIVNEGYLIAAEELGREMAKRSHELIFGGGQTGLMGAVARGITDPGGYCMGIAPRFFDKPGVLFEDCTKFIFTDNMRERKELMEKESEAFIMTPGGIGTLEEFIEVLTLKQLKQLNKPLGVLNTSGYFDEFITMLETMVEKKFMNEECMKLFVVADEPDELLGLLEEQVYD